MVPGWFGDWSVCMAGRSNLPQRILAAQLTTASSEAVALQSIDALLRLDANATIEVSRGLAHPEFMVANAAFRALGGQLDAWAKLEPADRLQRMQKVVAELERIPEDIDQDHRILVSGLASRIYADTLGSREIGAGDVLEGCRRVLARTDPQHVPMRVARLNGEGTGANVLQLNEQPPEVSPVPPPLAPLNTCDRQQCHRVDLGSETIIGSAAIVSPKRNVILRNTLSDQAEPSANEPPQRLHLTSGPNALPRSTRHQAADGD